MDKKDCYTLLFWLHSERTAKENSSLPTNMTISLSFFVLFSE